MHLATHRGLDLSSIAHVKKRWMLFLSNLADWTVAAAMLYDPETRIGRGGDQAAALPHGYRLSFG
jgi:hypothetical protein